DVHGTCDLAALDSRHLDGDDLVRATTHLRLRSGILVVAAACNAQHCKTKHAGAGSSPHAHHCRSTAHLASVIVSPSTASSSATAVPRSCRVRTAAISASVSATCDVCRSRIVAAPIW